ncbi:MAG: non-homologous end-joining DNA ligase, partial [Methanomicrobiales archaeon]|nr:non-homologous end-joining DNA ligase [Methanomicrobiales archaeon]
MTGPRYRPMLAHTAEAPFSSEDWLFEVKWDGIRAIAYAGKTLSLLSRSGRDMAGQFPELQEMADLAPGCVLDGEIVLLREGRNDMQALLGRFQETDPRRVKEDSSRLPVTFVAFDILEKDGRPLIHLPLEERRRILGESVGEGKYLVRSVAIRGDGEHYYEEAVRRGLEGVMAKRLGSPYEPGVRSDAWLKVKAVRTLDCVVFGYTKGEGAREGTFGALIVGLCDGGKGVYIGRVGTGFDQAALGSILAALSPLKSEAPTLTGAEKGKITWVRPAMVIEAAYHSVTREGRLRMPRFLGIRTDKAPEDCTPDQLGPGRNLLSYQAKRDFAMTP